MSANAHDLFHDVMDVAESTDRCTCVSMSHVTDAPGYREFAEDVLDILGTLAMTADDILALRGAVGHVLNVVVAVGYAIGASDAYDITLSTEIVVPDSLSALDFVETYGERPEDN